MFNYLSILKQKENDVLKITFSPYKKLLKLSAQL